MARDRARRTSPAPSSGLLFYYRWSLALVATLITVAMALGTAGLGYLDVRCQREVMAASGRLSGLLPQVVNGVGKLCGSATEHRAFAAWAVEFSRRMVAARRGRPIGIGLPVFRSVMPLLAVAAVFSRTVQLLSREAGSGLSTGAFLAFNAAFVQFQAAALGLSSAAVTVLDLVPRTTGPSRRASSAPGRRNRGGRPAARGGERSRR